MKTKKILSAIFMKRNLIFSILIQELLLLSACSSNRGEYDATGTFESEEIIVSSEATGRLLQFDIEEGINLKTNQVVGLIDTTQLYLKKKQLHASIKAIMNKLPDINTQLATIREQIHAAEREKRRIENLVKSSTAAMKQLDDINAQIELLNKQLAASESNLSITRQGLLSETHPLHVQIEQIQDQIYRSIINNPVEGTVLTRYAKQNEITSAGKPLYKIADLSSMTLRAYISGDQFAKIIIGQPVKVYIDNGEGELKEVEGEIYWISSKAEFTPKTIQTKDERANLVYAIKIKVKNDGYIKIGMYGEVKL